MGPEILKFYTKLYEKDINVNVDNDQYLSAVDCKLTTEQNKILDSPITLDELYSTLLTCKDSSPGLDGIPYSLYKKFWDVLGIRLLNSWNYSLSVGELLQDQRHSVISLLQKPGKPVGNIDNLRPINLSNCDIKLVTKVLTKRVLKCNNIFSKIQTAYIRGRRLSENLLTIQLVIDHCDENNLEGYLVSLDAKKAFDSIDHDFMLRVLKEFNFSKKFIHIIKTFYINLTTDVMVNGIRYGLLKILKGVKQGDSMSCVLFI